MRIIVNGGTLLWVRFGPVEYDSLRLESVEMMNYGLEEWEFGGELGELRSCAVDNISD